MRSSLTQRRVPAPVLLLLTITLDNAGCPSGRSDKPYASGAYRTTGFYGYGRYAAHFKAARGSGLMARPRANPAELRPPAEQGLSRRIEGLWL